MKPLRLLSCAILAAAATVAPLRAQETPPSTPAPAADGTGSGTFDPNEIRRGVRMGGEGGKSREQVMFERAISQVEPDLKGKLERLAAYANQFRLTMVGDPKIMAFAGSAEMGEDGTVVLTGYAEYEEHRRAFEKYFGYLGFEKVDNRLEQLPSESLGEKRFAVVRVAHTTTYDKVAKPRENMTTGLLGEPVFLLKPAEEGYYLCHTAEGYVGFIDGNDVETMDEASFTAWTDAPKATILADFEAKDAMIPAGARLNLAESPTPDSVGLTLPGGRVVAVPKDQVVVRPNQPNPLAIAAVDVARKFLGCKYVWGGNSSDGIDCSGLVQTAYKSQGINLARDAYQQAYSGALVATRWHRENLRPGDTLYFLGRGGKISHTAISAGGDLFVEASGSSVRITSFDPDSEFHNDRRDDSFCFAKRVLE